MGETTSRHSRAITASPSLERGSKVRHYEIVKEIGRGGMGIVYEARDVKLGRRVAIKMLHSTTRDIADRFLIEARATARCTHENIVVIHEVDEHDNAPYMVLELIEGRSLRDVMGSEPIEPTRVIDIVLQVARALQRAHGLGIVHRDLKPENVLVTDAGQVKVLDFGIAKALGDGPDQIVADRSNNLRPKQLQLTAEGAIVGTLPYISPEQLGVAPVDARTDLWALGIFTFEMLAGRHPIVPLSNEALIGNLLSEEPMASARTLTGVPAGLADIVDRCLAKKKTDRIADAATLVNRLETLRVERRSAEIAPVHAVAPPKHSRRSRVIVAFASVLLAGGIATALIIRADRDEAVAPAIVPPPPKPAPAPPEPAPPPPDQTPVAAPPTSPEIVLPSKPKRPVNRPKPKPGSGAATQGSGSSKPCSIYTDRVGC